MSGFPTGTAGGLGTEIRNTRTLAQGGPYQALIIDGPSNQQTATLALFPQLPYLYAQGMALSQGSPGPTDTASPASTNYAFNFASAKALWLEAPVNGNDGVIFLNANGDGTAAQFPWVLGKNNTSAAFNTLAASGAALTFPNDAGTALAAWVGAGTTPPALVRFFSVAQVTTEINYLARAITSQTGLLHAWQNNVPTTVSGVGPDGGILFGNNSTAVTASSPGFYGGTGAPSNTLGANGSYYFRADGGVNTHFYFKSAGAWAAMSAF